MLAKHIIEILEIHYGIQVTSLNPLFLGADINASTFKADTYENSYFIKLRQGSLPKADLLNLLPIQQMIRPLKNAQGQSFFTIDSYTLTVYPFIESQNAFNQPLTDDQWVILGKALRTIHEFKVPHHLIRKETYSSKWRNFVRSLNLDAEPSGDEWAIKLLTFMKSHKEEIHRLVNTAESLGKNPPHAENVLCHSDIHGGNVLIDVHGSIYMIDWDDPILAPKERDLMFIGGGVANVWNNPHEEELFYKGYGKTKINKSLLSYYRHERIVEDIAEYVQELLLKTGGNNRKEMYHHFLDMFKPNGVVEIAFRTAAP